MFRIVAFSYPNNEIRAVFSALPSMKRPVLPSDSDLDPVTSPACSFVSEIPLIDSDPALSLVPNSKRPAGSVGYGLLPSKPTVFGLNAKRILVRSGGALEKSIDSPDQCLFLTATLPASTEDAFRAIAEWSGYIVNGLKAWIAKSVRSKLDFYCWEYQRRGALHLHYCVYVPDEQARNPIQSGFKNWWIELLHRVGEKSNTDLFRKNKNYTHLSDTSKVRAVAEICRKSPARYLAKYLSKSAKGLKGRARFFTPSRWWGTSRPLKQILESMTSTVELIQGSYFDCVKKLQEVSRGFESSDGKTYQFQHKYGMGKTLLAYPASVSDNAKLFEDLEDMSSISRIDKRLEQFKPSVMLRPHKSRLLNWSFTWIHQLPSNEGGMIETLKEFHDLLQRTVPSHSDEPLMMIYEWKNALWNLSECIGYSKCGRNYEDRKMIERVLSDLEIAISFICKNGWQ